MIPNLRSHLQHGNQSFFGAFYPIFRTYFVSITLIFSIVVAHLLFFFPIHATAPPPHQYHLPLSVHLHRRDQAPVHRQALCLNFLFIYFFFFSGFHCEFFLKISVGIHGTFAQKLHHTETLVKAASISSVHCCMKKRRVCWAA